MQGVGSVSHVLEAARVENVQGWVRNLPDGSVEAQAEGDREAVDANRAQDPARAAGARVENVEVDRRRPDRPRRWIHVR